MKTLSLIQPWASLIALGEKRIETRSWGTRYRGPLAIHASLSHVGDDLIVGSVEPFASVLARHGIGRILELPALVLPGLRCGMGAGGRAGQASDAGRGSAAGGGCVRDGPEGREGDGASAGDRQDDSLRLPANL